MVKTVVEILSVQNSVFTTFVAYSSLLVIKMILMGFYTAFTRARTKAFANPEDAGGRNVRFKVDEVERVRRAHRNDMENILPSFLIGLMYVLINPSAYAACMLFRIGAIARIVHSIVYAVVVMPQPSRALSFFIHYLITAYMAIAVLYHLF